MKLTRIALEEFRRFRAPLVLDGLQDGLNVFVAPNEAGKSTVATALRAAFLERYKTGTVDSFAPWQSTGARPTVALDFEVGGQRYALRKSFLTRARCELLIDDVTRLDGEEAEKALATLLGFELAARGASKPEYAGVPGLLWIRQGEGQNLLEPAGHAGQHLRDALARQSGELLSGDGDRVFARVGEDRAAMRDARSGRPKGDYKAAIDAHADAQTRHAELLAAQAALDQHVDELARLRAAHAAAEAAQPWTDFEAQAAQARGRLEAIAQQRDALAALQRELAQADQTIEALQEQVARDQRDDEALAQAQRELAEADIEDEDRRAAVQRAEAAADRARQAVAVARAALDAATALAERRDLAQQAARATQDRERLHAARTQAAALAKTITTLQGRLARERVDPKALQGLKQQAARLEELRVRLDAVSTRLHYRIDVPDTVRLNGEALHGERETSFAEPVDIEIAGIGRLRIAPGGADLPTLRTEIDTLRGQHLNNLRALGVDKLEDLDTRARAADRTEAELTLARKELAIHAPQGVNSLDVQADEAAAREQALLTRLAALPAAVDDDGASLPTRQAAHRAAQADAEQTAQTLAQLRTAAERSAARRQLLHAQVTARQAEQRDPQAVQLRGERGARLIARRAMRETLMQRIAVADQAIAAHQPAVLEQDVRRFGASARIAREEHEQRYARIVALQARLEAEGAQGLGDQLAQAAAEVERLGRRAEQLNARAQALDLLYEKLCSRRDLATQRLHAPLAQRLNHYLHLLFPAASLRLDDQLLPTGLQRSEGEGALDALSFGTQEQLGVLVRFAYADLLKEAGRPTLLVLDDALVHADEARRAAMKRALFDAATRHQILIFSCHADAWSDLGVPVRRLADGGSSQPT